jgi:hypothetical protein
MNPLPVRSPRVSVLMTVFNGGAFLAKSVESVIAQSFSDWELIVVENGSTDGSRSILASYTDARIRVLPLESNIGRTPALRLAFESARGQYIAVLDADDVAHPDRFLKQVAALDANPDVVLLGTWVDYIDEHDELIGESTPPSDARALLLRFAYESPITHSSALYRADVARASGGYPAELAYSQDYGLWLKLLQSGRPAILEERLCRFRILSQSLTRSASNRITVASDLLTVMFRARTQFRLDAEAMRANREEIAIARVRYAIALARGGRPGAAAAEAWRALVTDPLPILGNRITRGFFAR